MSGTTIRTTYSVCPVCKNRIEAHHVERDNAVYLEKTCPEHGFFSTIIWSGLRDMNAWRGAVKDVSIQAGDDCPNACGLCEFHQSGTCCVLLEVTKRCNLRCPYCFADGGEGEDLPFDQIVRDIRSLAVQGQTLLQLSGGEPTVRDDLAGIIREAKSAGCKYVQLNTNGVRLATDKEYLHALKDAGLSFVFMQFDGMDDRVYRTLRGRELLAIKKQAIQNCGELNIGVTLVPTVVPGVNDHQIGDILRFAVSQSPYVRGLHFQPVSYFGRTPSAPDNTMRYTLDRLLFDLDAQASDVLPFGSLKPSRCDHPLCGFHGDYAVMPDGSLYSLLSEGDFESVVTADQNRSFVAKRWDRSREAGESAANTAQCACCDAAAYVREPYDIGQTGCQCCGEERVDMNDMGAFLQRVRSHGFTVTAMAFQDAWNLDLERLKRCSLHVFKGGKFIPFCMHYL